jgi:hypothetical protein
VSVRNLLRIKTLYDRIREGIDYPERRADAGYWYRLCYAAGQVQEVREMLTGYKTYICAVGIGLVSAASALGYLDEATKNALLGLFGAGAIGALAAKGNRAAGKP